MFTAYIYISSVCGQTDRVLQWEEQSTMAMFVDHIVFCEVKSAVVTNKTFNIYFYFKYQFYKVVSVTLLYAYALRETFWSSCFSFYVLNRSVSKENSGSLRSTYLGENKCNCFS